MTETEWLACADPKRMLDALRPYSSERKMRLFLCACARRLWPLLTIEEVRSGVEVAEQYADGRAAVGELDAARIRARDAHWREWMSMEGAGAGAPRTEEQRGVLYTLARVHIAAYAAARGDQLHYYNLRLASPGLAAMIAPDEECHRCHLIRDLYCPIRTPVVQSRWLTWNDGAVPRIATAIYESRNLPAGTLDNPSLTVLADALEDGGCDNADILAHCRNGGEHVRGCWVVDLLLGKS
jgi:hypothetical protein